MRKLLLSLALLTLVPILPGCSPRAAFDSFCEHQLQPASLALSSEEEPLVIRNTLSRSEISQNLRTSGSSVEGSLAMASTTASLEQQGSFRFDSFSLGAYACGKPQARLKIVLRRPVVDIARDFAPGSCRYDTVKFHEMKHVQAYERAMEQAARRAQQLFDVEYPRGYIATATSAKDFDALSVSLLEDWLSPAVSKELARVRDAHRAIDTQAEYLRLTLACPDEPLLEPLPALARH